MSVEELITRFRERLDSVGDSAPALHPSSEPQPGCTAETQPGLSSGTNRFQQQPGKAPQDSSCPSYKNKQNPLIIQSTSCCLEEEKDTDPQQHVGEENMKKV